MKGEGRPSSSRAAVLQPRRRKGEREREIEEEIDSKQVDR